MLFKKISSTKAIITHTSVNSVSRKIIGAVTVLITIAFGLTLGGNSDMSVIYWASAALLTWHLLFVKVSIEIDLNKRLISTQINSVYPVAKQDIPMDNIKAFSLDFDPKKTNHYNLLIISSLKDKPFKFNFGSQAEMNRLGHRIAKFSGKPFLT